MKSLLVALTTVLMTACTIVPPATTEAFLPGKYSAGDVTVVVTLKNQLFALDGTNKSFVQGRARDDVPDFTFSGYDYALKRNISMSGKYDNAALSADVKIPRTEIAYSYALQRDRDFDQPLRVVGQFRGVNETYNVPVVIKITEGGVLTGSDSQGCTFNGNFKETGKAYGDVVYTMNSNCGSFAKSTWLGVAYKNGNLLTILSVFGKFNSVVNLTLQ